MLSQKELSDHQIRERNAQGNLIRSGFRWYEPRFDVQNKLGAGGLVLIVLGIVMLIGLVISIVNQSAIGIVFFATFLLISIFFAYVLSKDSLDRWMYHRKVIFCDDGKVLFSFSNANSNYKLDPVLAPLENSHTQITSIESFDVGNADVKGTTHRIYAVRLVFNDGQIQPVGTNFVHPDDVRLIVVQLNHALEEIRESLAQRHRQGDVLARRQIIE